MRPVLLLYIGALSVLGYGQPEWLPDSQESQRLGHTAWQAVQQMRLHIHGIFSIIFVALYQDKIKTKKRACTTYTRHRLTCGRLMRAGGRALGQLNIGLSGQLGLCGGSGRSGGEALPEQLAMQHQLLSGRRLPSYVLGKCSAAEHFHMEKQPTEWGAGEGCCPPAVRVITHASS